MIITIIVFFIGYVLLIISRLGLFERIPLALGKISIETLPDRAAKKYGNTILFISDKPCRWDIPALRNQYADNLQWSAKRIKMAAGFLAKMLQDYFQLQKDERVAILKQNHFDIHIFITAIVRAGGIACPINGKFESENIEPYLSNLGSKVLITDYVTMVRILDKCNGLGFVQNILFAEQRENFSASVLNGLTTSFIVKFPHVRLTWLEDSMREADSEALAVSREKKDILYLVHSSGTTGFPKAVILQNGPQSLAMRGWLCYVHVSRKKDKAYLAVPNNHQAVILSFNSLLLMGMKVYWASTYDAEGFDGDKIINELEQGGYTGFFGFPIAYTQLKEKLQNPERLKKMRFWASTADASHEAIIKKFVATGSAFKSLGIPIKGSVFLDAQGSSEVGTPSVLRYITPFTRKFDRRIGKPGSTPFGPKIRVTTTSGNTANINETGRLEVKGKTVFTGYWKNPALTDKSFTDGWFFTGDTVRISKDRNVVQLDREVDVIHTATGEVYSLPIEEKIHKHPAIFDACVYGAYDSDGFQTPQIAVALRDGYDYDEHTLLMKLNNLLTHEEQLAQCRIMEWSKFPIGVTGKTLKRIFRERSKDFLPDNNKITSPDFLEKIK